jgi:hypothetical protein
MITRMLLLFLFTLIGANAQWEKRQSVFLPHYIATDNATAAAPESVRSIGHVDLVETPGTVTYDTGTKHGRGTSALAGALRWKHDSKTEATPGAYSRRTGVLDTASTGYAF